MRLYTLLKQIENRIVPIIYGGTGASTPEGVVNNFKTSLIDLIYPIGSTYTSTSSTSPEVLFGGTWEQIKDTFLLSAGDTYEAGSTGGESSHVLTDNEMSSHTHTFTGTSVNTSKNGAHTHNIRGWQGSGGSNTGIQYYWTYRNSRTISGHALSNGNHTHTATAAGTNSNTGDGSAHNNMPPYLTVYMWKRTG